MKYCKTNIFHIHLVNTVFTICTLEKVVITIISNSYLYNPDNISSKSILRTQVKENFSDLTIAIFDYTATNCTLNSSSFTEAMNLHTDYFAEYCEQLKNSLKISTSVLSSKKAPKDIFVSYKAHLFKLSQGLSSKSQITINLVTADSISAREKIHDIEKIRINLMFN